MTNFLFWRITDQLQVEADELQAGHQREEEREVVMTADQSVPDVEEKQLLNCHITYQRDITKEEIQFPLWRNQRLLEVIFVQQRLVLLKEAEIALQRALA